ncbi:MAG: hypothetical protein ACREA2_06485 [Blastocatellia bacterium]
MPDRAAYAAIEYRACAVSGGLTTPPPGVKGRFRGREEAPVVARRFAAANCRAADRLGASLDVTNRHATDPLGVSLDVTNRRATAAGRLGASLATANRHAADHLGASLDVVNCRAMAPDYPGASLDAGTDR